METREINTGRTGRVSKHLRMDTDIHQWFAIEAKKENRSVNAEMEMALKYWMKTRRNMETSLSEEKDLSISAKDIEADRLIIRRYEDKIKDFEAKANAANGSRRGAYQGHITKTKRALDAMSGNLAYHLDWLRRFKPEVYEEVANHSGNCDGETVGNFL